MPNALGPWKKKSWPHATFRSPQEKVVVPIPANVVSPVDRTAAKGSPGERGVGSTAVAEADEPTREADRR